jgi:hypothetical protein
MSKDMDCKSIDPREQWAHLLRVATKDNRPLTLACKTSYATPWQLSVVVAGVVAGWLLCAGVLIYALT